MRNQLRVLSVAASVSVLIIGSACSTNIENEPTPSVELARDQNQALYTLAESAEISSRQKSRMDSAVGVPLSSMQPNPSFVPQTVITETETYQPLNNNPVIQVADQSTSTFSIDVDTGSYANMRRFLNAGQMPPIDAVRIEELLNYFNYDYSVPESIDTPFSIHTELATTPWNNKTKLLHIGLKGYAVDAQERPPANLVFLIDVSGSMASEGKLGLLKASILMLSKNLTKDDTVSVVVYAGASGVVLEPTTGNNVSAIKQALHGLRAGGSTNGEAGIELAYSLAEKSMSDDSINRIILATDGDFNVGTNDIDQLKNLIERKRKSGIALTTLGFGRGNYNDQLMEQLADTGNGNYAYIDTLSEARKVLSEELTSTLLTIAKDVKIQIEFNPAQVSEYRLLGYINRKLANEDFLNDKVDAGEIGAGHTVTALYEIALTGEGGERNTASRYQKTQLVESLTNEIAEVRLRFKRPDESTSQATSRLVTRDSLITELSKSSENFRFSAAVAGFGQLLRQSKYLDEFVYDDAATLASTAIGPDRFGYRAEFVRLIDLASALDE